MAISLSKKQLVQVLSLKDEYSKTLKDTGDKIKDLDSKSKKGFSSMNRAITQAGSALKAYFGLHAMRQIGSYIFEVANEVESLKLRLVGIKGGVTEAGEAFEYFRQVASKVPFSLGEIANAGVTIEAFGADSKVALKEVTDLAAFMGTDLATAANAFGRAWAGGVGAADVLRDRGILNTIKELKPEVEDLTKLTLPEFRKVLLESMQDTSGPIANSASRMADTLAGKWSMLTDKTYTLAESLGDTGLTDAAKIVIDSIKDIADITGSVVKEFNDWTDSVFDLIVAIQDLNFDQMKTSFGKLLIDMTEMQEEFQRSKLFNLFATVATTGAYQAVPPEVLEQRRQEIRELFNIPVEEADKANRRKANKGEDQSDIAGDGGYEFFEEFDSEAMAKHEESLAEAREKAQNKLIDKLSEFGKTKKELLKKQYDEDLALLAGNLEQQQILTQQYMQAVNEIDAADEQRRTAAAEKEQQERQKREEALQAKIDSIIFESLTEREQLEMRYAEQQAMFAGHEEVLLILHKNYLAEKKKLDDAENSKESQSDKKAKQQKLANQERFGNALLSLGESFAGENAEQNKAYGILNATISTYVGAAKALELPFPENIAAVATVLSTGFAQVKAIKAASKGGGAEGGSVSGGTTTTGPVETPTPDTVPQQERETRSQTIVIQGTVLGTEEFVREQLAPLIASAAADNVDFNLVTKVEGQN